MMALLWWGCANCEVEGDVELGPDQETREVVREIERQHAELSPGCQFDESVIEVIQGAA